MKGRERAVLIGAVKGRQPVEDFNEVNLLELDSVKQAKLEYFIAKRIGEELCRVYPKREWYVEVDTRNEMVIIMCHSVSAQRGYYLSMKRDPIQELQRRAVRAAGEILERHGLSRSREFNPDVVETLKRDVKDNVITQDSAPTPVGGHSHV